MFMRNYLVLGAVSLAAMGAAAIAMPDGPASIMDGDGNGVVSKAEAMAAADAMFVKMDANGDGTISPADREAKVKEHFRQMDSNSDGSISEAEFLAAHKDRMAEREARGAALDGMHEGRGGRHRGGHDGPRGGMMLLKAADSNGDQTVSKDEFRSAAEARFAKTDTDKNGSLSAAERKAAWKAMRGAGRAMEQGPDGDGPPPPPMG
jgi:EF hand